MGNTGGRALGLRFDGAGTLWIADALEGLLTWTESAGFHRELQTVEGIPMRFPDHLTISKDGRDIYLSDASTKYDLHTVLDDFLEGRPWGRIVHYHVPTKEARVVAKGLYFPNGVDLTADEKTLVFSEMALAHLVKLNLKTGQRSQLVGTQLADNLAPVPGTDYTWAAYGFAREALEMIVGSTLLRRMLRRLPAPSNEYCECARIHKVTGEVAEVRRMVGAKACSVCTPDGHGNLLVGDYQKNVLMLCKVD